MPRRPLPWIKLWFDILGDPKMKRLSIAERGCWDGMLLLAGQSPVRGKLMLTETQPMTIRDISKALNLTNREVSSLKGCISKMIELHSLRWSPDNSLEVINFKKRQDVYASDFENYHEKSAKLTETLPKFNGNLRKNIHFEEARTGLNKEQTDIKSSEFTPNNSVLTPDKVLKEVEVEVEGDIDLTPLPGGKGVPDLLSGSIPEKNRVLQEFKAMGYEPNTQPESRVTGRDGAKPNGVCVPGLVPGEEPAKKGNVRSKTLTQPESRVTGRDGAKPKRLSNNPMIAKMQSYLGYPDKTDPIPNPGKEAKFIHRMQSRGFTDDQIFNFWCQKVNAQEQFVSMEWVNEDIGKKEKRSAEKKEKPIEGLRIER